MREKIENLKDQISGDLFTDELTRYMLSTDAGIFKKMPAAVVYPKNKEDVAASVKFAGKNGFTVHPRGSGSGLCGSALGSGIIIDFSRYMNKLINLDCKEKTFECMPGYRLGELEEQIKGKGLFFPPDPSSGEYASFGGMYSTNASGAHSVKYGNVSDYIADAEIILSSGQTIVLSEIKKSNYSGLPQNLRSLYDLYQKNADIINKSYPAIKCNVCGYNLKNLIKNKMPDMSRLFAGSEGTLGIAVKLKFRVIEKPAFDSLVVAFFANISDSVKSVQKILPMNPSGIEIMDKSLLHAAGMPFSADNLLLIEFDSFDTQKCAQQAEQVKNLFKKEKLANQAYTAVSESEKAEFWNIRKAAVPMLYKLKGRKKIIALIEDAAVPTDKMEEYFAGIYRILNKNKVEFVVYGHIAKGLLHNRPLLDLKDKKDVGLLKIIADEVFELVNKLEGTVSGEHGDGRLRSAYIKQSYPEIYHLFLKTKELLDKDNILNPEIKKSSVPNLVKKNLRYDYDKPILKFAEAEKCHGCSKCTTVTSIVRMCPVYKFTRYEQASPKAKANVLRALISGAVNEKKIYEISFQNVMNLCANSGSCSKECPSNVDIPKMAAEAKSVFAKRFGVPLGVKLSAQFESAVKSGVKFSGFSNIAVNSGIIQKVAEKFAKLDLKNSKIRLAAKSLFDKIPEKTGNTDFKVLYFAGCYASYIRPEIGIAAVKVLKNTGACVYLPRQNCCGLPMISKGMFKNAEEKIKQNIEKWKHLLSEVDFITVTCSSCGLSLIREWSYILNNYQTHRISKKTIHITDLINKYGKQFNFSNSALKAAYHAPCHLKIQQNPQCSIELLRKISQLQISELKSHCCGIAGTWGMQTEYADLSRKIGSDLIKKIEESKASVAITDCPTCEIQIKRLGNIGTMHPVEVVNLIYE